MARIKSTVDLIMERTRHLSLNAEEKAAFERQQLTQRVQGPLARYLKGERDAEYLVHELDQLPAEVREEGKRICLGLLMDSLSPFADNERILAAAERLRGEAERTRWQETLAPLETESRADLQRARDHAVTRCRQSLAEAGLKGPALLPPVDEQDPSWKEEQERRLEAFRTRVKKALGLPQM